MHGTSLVFLIYIKNLRTCIGLKGGKVLLFVLNTSTKSEKLNFSPPNPKFAFSTGISPQEIEENIYKSFFWVLSRSQIPILGLKKILKLRKY